MLPVGLSLLPLLAAASDAHAPDTGLQRVVVFTDYSPDSRNTELLRRLASPLTALRAQLQLVRSGTAIREQSLDLAQEKFTVYVPSESPPGGYGLLVFVPPWKDAIVPRGWIAALDRHGLIFVSAARSGNEANILARREPLALLAAHNIMQRYPVDPQRVYIGGFSGGARVALRLALGFPDLFRGALLNAGSDPIGDAQAPLPPAELFRQFQDSTRLVYLTGNDDLANIDHDAASVQSMRQWCQFNLDTQSIAWAGHDVADSRALQRALDALTTNAPQDPVPLAACRSRIDTLLAAKLQQVQELVTGGKLHEARALLNTIDTRFGGLAAPRSLELAQQIDARP